MKIKSLACLAFLGVLTNPAVAQSIDTSQTQHIYVTNLLDSPGDDFPARTQTPIKIEARQGGKTCYTVRVLNFGDMYQFTASSSDVNCKYISEIIMTTLPVNQTVVYAPEEMRVKIDGGNIKYTQVTVIQKPGKSNEPLFNADGTVAIPGSWDYQLGAGFKS